MVKKGFAAVALSSLVVLLLILSSVASSIAQADSDNPPGYDGDTSSGLGSSGDGGDSSLDVPPGYSPTSDVPPASDGGGEGPSGPVDDIPSAAVYVPSSATPGSQIQVLVTATDDKAVSQLLLFNEADVLTDVVECLGAQAACSQAFTKAAPSAFGASYVFRARAKDSAGQLSNVASASGLTTAAFVLPLPIITPTITPVTTISLPSAAPAPSGPVRALQGVVMKFPLQPLFMRALGFVDSDCMRPGESALLAVNIRNVGRKTLGNVRFSATVPELGIRSAIGPFRLTSSDKSTRFLSVNIPADAADGQYFLRFVASDSVSNRIVHRIFTVDRSC